MRVIYTHVRDWIVMGQTQQLLVGVNMHNQENSDNSFIFVVFLVMGFVVVTALIFRPQSSIIIDLGNGKPSVKISDVEKVPLKP